MAEGYFCRFTDQLNYSPYMLQICSQYPPALEKCFNECVMDAQPNPITENHERNIANTVPEEIVVVDEVTTQQSLQIVPTEIEHPWKRCPEPGSGLQSIFLTCFVDGRLGNVVWNFLSLWASAKRHNVRPIMNKSSLDFMLKIFNQTAMNIPTVEEIDEKCNLDGLLTEMYANGSNIITSRYDLFKQLEVLPEQGYKMLNFYFYLVNSEELVPLWNQLSTELVLNSEFVDEAQRQLHEIKEMHVKLMVKKYSLLILHTTIQSFLLS
jgi:hypothetical protein